MMLRTEADIIKHVKNDQWMMKILAAAASLDLPDWWVCAGFVRSKIWDTMHNFSERTSLQDIDVIYFDPSNTDESEEKIMEDNLWNVLPDVPWSVKNEARMHLVNNVPAYTSSEDAISQFPETVTALGLKLDEQEKLMLTAPHGIQDVLQMKVRPTPNFEKGKGLEAIYEERMIKKNWQAVWPKVKIESIKITKEKGVFK